MREKLETLSLVQLKALAKAEGLKGISTMKKADLVELLVEHAGRQEQAAQTKKEAQEQPQASAAVQTSKPPAGTVNAGNTGNIGTAVNIANTANTANQGRQQSIRQSAGQGSGQNGRGTYRKQGRNAVNAQSDANTQNGRQDNQGSRQSNIQSNRNNSNNSNIRYNDRNNRQGIQTDRQGRQNTNPNNRNLNLRQNGSAQSNQGSMYSTDAAGIGAAQTNQPRPRVTEPEGIKASELDSGEQASGILEIMQDGFGFIRSDNFLPGEDDVYVAPSQIRKFDLRTGDVITGSKRVRTAAEKFAALLYVKTINGQPADSMPRRRKFENLTPIFPNQRIHLDTGADTTTAVRIVDIISPIGKGQRGMIVSPPKAGKTTLLKQIAKAVKKNEPDMHIIILLIDERPEEVTDMKEEVEGPSVEVIYSTFDEQPEQHKRVSEMVIERAKRLVEQGQDVMILLDSITRLSRAYNLTVTPSGRTLSGGLDPAALYMPKRFFGAARNLREGGSLTILATALIDTGSRLDDMVFEEFKGTGNMELVLDRKLSERRIFPAIDILKSGTRRDDLLLSVQEQDASNIIHKMVGGSKPEETAEVILDLFTKTRTNREFIERLRMYRR